MFSVVDIKDVVLEDVLYFFDFKDVEVIFILDIEIEVNGCKSFVSLLLFLDLVKFVN